MNTIKIEIGTDVSQLLGITKYEAPIPAQLAGLVKGNFPSFCSKSDEPRIQNYPEVLSECLGEQMVGCMKLDGTSSTFYLRDDDFGVCSRNLDLKFTEDNTYWKIAKSLNIEQKMREYRDHCTFNGIDINNFSIQGEIVGEGINGNKLKLKGHHLFLFSLFDIDKHQYRSHMTLKNFREFSEIKMVPEVMIMKFDENVTVKSLLEISNNLNYDSGHPAEGIVWRPIHREIYSETIRGRLSFKVISNRFLIYTGE